MKPTFTVVVCGSCGARDCQIESHRRMARDYAKGERTVLGRRFNELQRKFEYYYPARADAPIPSDYERIELESVRDLEKHGKETGNWNEHVSYDSGQIDALIPTDMGESDPDLSLTDVEESLAE